MVIRLNTVLHFIFIFLFEITKLVDIILLPKTQKILRVMNLFIVIIFV